MQGDAAAERERGAVEHDEVHGSGDGDRPRVRVAPAEARGHVDVRAGPRRARCHAAVQVGEERSGVAQRPDDLVQVDALECGSLAHPHPRCQIARAVPAWAGSVTGPGAVNVPLQTVGEVGSLSW